MRNLAALHKTIFARPCHCSNKPSQGCTGTAQGQIGLARLRDRRITPDWKFQQQGNLAIWPNLARLPSTTQKKRKLDREVVLTHHPEQKRTNNS